MGWDAWEPARQGCASGAGMPLLRPDMGVPARVRVQGLPRQVPMPFLMARLVRGSLSRGNAAVRGMEGACLVEGAVFLGARAMLRLSPAHTRCSDGPGAGGAAGLAHHWLMPSRVTSRYPSRGPAQAVVLGTQEGGSPASQAPWLQPCQHWWPHGP